MKHKLALASIVIVALLHLGFLVLEATQWSSPLGLELHHLSEPTARETTGVAKNMALYNGFLGVLLLWATFALGGREARAVQRFTLAFIVVAGIVGAVTIHNPRIFLLQSLPAVAALVLIGVDRPERTPGS